jgi:hypothetical protein
MFNHRARVSVIASAILVLTSCGSKMQENQNISVPLRSTPPADYQSQNTTQAQSVQGTSSCIDYTDNFSLPYRYCDSGSEVTKIQLGLIQAGYKVDADGYFGPGTESAVKKFQAANSLSVTGNVDSKTWSLLTGDSEPSSSTSSGSFSRPKEIQCVDGKSIYACTATWSDGSERAIQFPNSGNSHRGQTQIDSTDAKDDYRNPYCVYLYADGQGSFKGGTCSSASAPVGGSATAVGIQCPGRNIGTCEVTWSNGRITFVNGVHGSTAPITATTTMYEMGQNRVCVNLHSDGKIGTRYC